MRNCFALIVWLLLCGCQSITLMNPDSLVLQDALSGKGLLNESQLSKPIESLLPEDEFMALSEEMKRFVDFYVPKRGSQELRISRLLAAIGSKGNLGVAYDPYQTHTARDAFHFREANCLSYTAMFVAMARYADIDVSFNEVDVPPIWDYRDSGSLVFYRHVNAKVHVTRRVDKVVDVNLENYRMRYDQRLIPDVEGEAQYYNNMGIEYLDQGDLTLSFLYLRKGIELAPSVAYLWSNLGALYIRAKRWDEAEAVLLRAIDLEDGDLVALSNLSKVKKAKGEYELAAQLAQKVLRLRESNAFYWFGLAQSAFHSGNLVQAREWIDKAIRIEDGDPRMMHLKASILLKNGDFVGSHRFISRAIEVSDSGEDVARYQSKLAALQSMDR